MVPAIAAIDRRNITVAVSLGPNRKAAHSSTGMHKKVFGYWGPQNGKNPPNTTPAVNSNVPLSRTASMIFWRSQSIRGHRAHKTNNGATIKSPVASPIHHVNQIQPYF